MGCSCSWSVACHHVCEPLLPRSREYLAEHWDDGADFDCFVMQSTMKTAAGQPLFYYIDRFPEGEYNRGKFSNDPTLVTANVDSMKRFLAGLDDRRAANLPNGMRKYLQVGLSR